MAFNKKMAMALGGAAAGGVGAVVIDGAIQNTDYAKGNPQNTFYAKAGGGVAAVLAGALVWRKSPLVGAILAVGGGVIAGKGYMDYSAYKEATAPTSLTVNPGAAIGGAPVTISAQQGGLPSTGGTPVLMASPGGVQSGLQAPLSMGVSPPPLALPAQSAGAMRLSQSGAAVRLGLSQSGAAVRLGMARR